MGYGSTLQAMPDWQLREQAMYSLALSERTGQFKVQIFFKLRAALFINTV